MNTSPTKYIARSRYPISVLYLCPLVHKYMPKTTNISPFSPIYPEIWIEEGDLDFGNIENLWFPLTTPCIAKLSPVMKRTLKGIPERLGMARISTMLFVKVR